jgi:hypothetical protein
VLPGRAHLQGGIMAYSGGEGSFVKAANVTDVLALEFLNVPSADLSIYFDFADSMIIRIAAKNGIAQSSIAVDSTGSPTDALLKEYGLAWFCYKLFSDKTAAFNFQDTGSLSDSSSYDKYEVKTKLYKSQIQMLEGMITGWTITGTANDSKSFTSVVDFSRS